VICLLCSGHIEERLGFRSNNDTGMASDAVVPCSSVSITLLAAAAATGCFSALTLMVGTTGI